MDFFTKSTEWLANTAGAASIDWSALAAKGQDSVNNPAYMDQYMLPAFNRCARVIDSLDIQRGTTTEVLLNYFEVRDKLSDTADEMLQVVGTMVQAVNPLTSPTLIWSAYNNLIWYMWAMALTGANMHVTAQIHKSGIPDADIAYHASLTTMMFNVITRMDDFGLFKPMKKGAANGLGALPLAAVIALGTVAIVAIAWAIVAIFEISQRNEVVKAACVKATESGDPLAIENCQKLFTTPEGTIAGSVPKTINDVIQKLAIAAMIGGGVYIMIQFGPGIATKVKQTMASWRTS